MSHAMNRRPARAALGAALAALLGAGTGGGAGAVPPPGSGKVNVTTYHNDNARTGQNLRETVLTPGLLQGNEPGRRFAKLWSACVDGQVYAQPLCLGDVPVSVHGEPAVTRDLVLVATQHNSVYAFDANDPGPNVKPVWEWHGNIGSLVPVPAGRYRPDGYSPDGPNVLWCIDIVPEVGITGTPVIDADSRRIYFVTKCQDTKVKVGDPRRYVQRVHCLDLTTGTEPFGPRVIEASCLGDGNGINEDERLSPEDRKIALTYAGDAGYDLKLGTNDGNHRVRFVPKSQNQRAGLLLLDGVVYITWSSHGDRGAYHGWLIGYRADNLEQTAVLNTTPNGNRGAIWQGGAAPAADDQHHIFLATGNGSFNASGTAFDGTTNFSNSVLKILAGKRSLLVVDYFTPCEWKCLNGGDRDLGSGGVILVDSQGDDPRPLLVMAGKSGTIYILNREHLGGRTVDGVDLVVREMAGAIGIKYGLGAYFNGSVFYGGGRIDDPPYASTIRRLELRKALQQHRPEFSAATHNGDQLVRFAEKGTTPTISANITDNAVLWTLRTDGGDELNEKEYNGRKRLNPAVLYAFETDDLGQLWASDVDASDGMGERVKFTVPTIANGRVFIGTGRSLDGKSKGELNAFGVKQTQK